VKDEHNAARAAYLDWMADGRPRNGPLFTLMSRTRATFKLALRYCRDHQDKLRANSYAKNLADQDFKSFWKDISKCNNAKSTKYANTIGNGSGEENITEMWRTHFDSMLMIMDSKHCYDRLENSISNYVITVHNVLECVSKQKTGKSIGLDGIATKAIVNGRYKLTIYTFKFII